ncbi:hypothetical protein [Halarchaeum salinum]|uniref:Uncharacterized protein n=1 Tax=Halarchaeum salinum TaxID=489912 RepID=A0AAV3S994_9EURY
MATQEWFFERWAGTILRWIMAYIFVFGVVLTLSGVLSLNIVSLVQGVILLAPYLIIRYRDPDSTTIPFRGYIS